MSQERLFGLAILSIENSRARNLDVQTVMKTFAHKKGLCDTRGVSQVGFNNIYHIYILQSICVGY